MTRERAVPFSRRKRRRQWRIPPALSLDRGTAGVLEGAALLEELPTPIALVLWETFRDAWLWTHAKPGTRSSLFHPGAIQARLENLCDDVLDGDARAAVERLAKLLLTDSFHAPDAAPQEVSRACGELAQWTATRGFFRSALLFAGAASAALPEDAQPALLVARIAGRVGWDTVTRAWLRRTIGIARRQADWLSYGEAYIESAWHAYADGDLDLARWRFARARRVGSRYSIPRLRVIAHVGSFRVAVAAKDMVAAEQHARAAIRASGGDRYADVSVFGRELAAIPLLPPDQKIGVLTGVVASAAAAGSVNAG